MIIVIMGVSGAGKSTVGRSLATRLGWPFLDADDLHSAANIQKLRQGRALNDEDRAPWLVRVRQVIADAARDGRHAVIACSALKERYRDILSDGIRDVRFVHLDAPADVLRERLASRGGHFMSAALLESQLHDLEPPAEALVVDARQPVERLVDQIAKTL